MKIHDISVSMTPTMPIYPGDPPVSIEPFSQISKGAAANISRLSFGDHTGTHLDPPVHFVPGGKTVDQLDLNTLYGAARVVDLTNVEKAISAPDFERLKLPSGTVRILCKTSNSDLWDRPGFQRDFVAFGWDAAQWLVDHGIKLIGIDYLSAEVFGASQPNTHHILLGAGIIIVEGLYLKNVSPGVYTLACLPLKIKDGVGGPARAVLIEE